MSQIREVLTKPKEQVTQLLPGPVPELVANLSFFVNKAVMLSHKGLMFWHENILAQTHDAMSQRASSTSLLWKQTPGALRSRSEVYLQCCHRFKTHAVGLYELSHLLPVHRSASLCCANRFLWVSSL